MNIFVWMYSHHAKTNEKSNSCQELPLPRPCHFNRQLNHLTHSESQKPWCHTGQQAVTYQPQSRHAHSSCKLSNLMSACFFLSCCVVSSFLHLYCCANAQCSLDMSIFLNGLKVQFTQTWKYCHYLLTLTTEETKLYRFGTTWQWVNDDWICIFGWINGFKMGCFHSDAKEEAIFGYSKNLSVTIS